MFSAFINTKFEISKAEIGFYLLFKKLNYLRNLIRFYVIRSNVTDRISKFQFDKIFLFLSSLRLNNPSTKSLIQDY